MSTKIHILLLSLLLAFTAGATGRPKADTAVCLVMNGKVSNVSEGPDNSCKIELFADNELVDSVLLKGNKRKFTFELKKNKHYVIRMSKQGFVTKNICIHTTVPATETERFEFEFETKLSEVKPLPALETEEKDLPVASIYYHEKKKSFYYHKAFSSYYQKQLCKSYRENNQLN